MLKEIMLVDAGRLHTCMNPIQQNNLLTGERLKKIL